MKGLSQHGRKERWRFEVMDGAWAQTLSSMLVFLQDDRKAEHQDEWTISQGGRAGCCMTRTS